MTGHLTPGEQIDALDRTLPPDRVAHLDACEACRHDLGHLRGAVEAARTVGVPEPSPLFWSHQSARISAMVAAESDERPRTTWTYAAWLGGAAAMVAAGLLFVRAGSAPAVSPLPVGRSQAISAGVPTADTEDSADQRAWSVVEDLGVEIDADAARATLTPASGAADRALEALDADEEAALIRALRTELKGKTG